LASRPAGSRLLAAAKKGTAVIVVAKLDRLFRSVADAANVIDDFDKKGIQLVAIAESFDMTSPYGRAMAQMASVFAELERAMIRERTRSAMSVKRSRGERISGHAPYGWDFGHKGRRFDRWDGGYLPPAHLLWSATLTAIWFSLLRASVGSTWDRPKPEVRTAEFRWVLLFWPVPSERLAPACVPINGQEDRASPPGPRPLQLH
jgi:resolvase-like protein